MDNFDAMYEEYEAKYNTFPTMMSRAEVFGKALRDGLITKEQYHTARHYFGKLWFYVGD